MLVGGWIKCGVIQPSEGAAVVREGEDVGVFAIVFVIFD